jgi:16S rRNA (guanine527-N7)-methyltransferase
VNAEWELLRSTTAAWGLPMSEAQLDQLMLYAAELQRWNAQHNLTTVDDKRGIVVRHFLDALRCALSWNSPPTRMADIGSGAGFPGLPLKILQPTIELTLVESVEKKAAFLRHIATTLGLSNVHILSLRAEELGRNPQHREHYDLVTARAVAELRVLAEYCLPLCRVGGRVLAPKGPQVEAEVAAAARAIDVLGGHLSNIEAVHLPGEPDRTLVVIDKVAHTPERYPRAVGIPAKRPL